jgi:multidrug efflux pump subunit AcrA (membrane-fusion protein)
MSAQTRRALALTLALLPALGLALAAAISCRATSPPQVARAEYFCPMHPKIVRDQPGDCPICGMSLEKRLKDGGATPPPSAPPRVLFYRHPMNPSVHSATPAKDEMGMDYVPVYEHEAAEHVVPGRATIQVDPDRAALLGVRSEPVGVASAGGRLRTVGRIAVDETRRQVVNAKYEGYVEELFVKANGEAVRRGQPLAAIYSPELVAAQQEYLVAMRTAGRLAGSAVPGVAGGGDELAEAARQRLRYWDFSAEDIAALQASGEARRTVTLRSPIAGVVVDKPAVRGLRVGPSDRLFEITDLSRVIVLAEVSEKDLAFARLGATADISLPGTTTALHGRVGLVAPVVKPETRTVEVRIEVDNTGGALKPDMLADVHLEAPRTTALTVPEAALVFTGERTLVFLDRGLGRFEPRELALGARVPGGYEVRSGLAPGDRVVIGANFLLDSESSLRAAIARATH